MRSVSMATCTSGEPVSLPSRLCRPISSVFFSFVMDILVFRNLRPSFDYCLISRFRRLFDFCNLSGVFRNARDDGEEKALSEFGRVRVHGVGGWGKFSRQRKCRRHVQVASEVTMITRECSGSFTVGSKGRTNPFSTTPATARGRRRPIRCISIGDGDAFAGNSSGGSGSSAAISSSRDRRDGLRWSDSVFVFNCPSFSKQ